MSASVRATVFTAGDSSRAVAGIPEPTPSTNALSRVPFVAVTLREPTGTIQGYVRSSSNRDVPV